MQKHWFRTVTFNNSSYFINYIHVYSPSYMPIQLSFRQAARPEEGGPLEVSQTIQKDATHFWHLLAHLVLDGLPKSTQKKWNVAKSLRPCTMFAELKRGLRPERVSGASLEVGIFPWGTQECYGCVGTLSRYSLSSACFQSRILLWFLRLTPQFRCPQYPNTICS